MLSDINADFILKLENKTFLSSFQSHKKYVHPLTHEVLLLEDKFLVFSLKLFFLGLQLSIELLCFIQSRLQGILITLHGSNHLSVLPEECQSLLKSNGRINFCLNDNLVKRSLKVLFRGMFVVDDEIVVLGLECLGKAQIFKTFKKNFFQRNNFYFLKHLGT